MEQQPQHKPQMMLFSDANGASGGAHRALPVLGEQSDIRYYGAPTGSVLNSPAATGMPYWSINPYVGCAFGCAYCYARYAHRYTMERAAAAGSLNPELHESLDAMPRWLAFERRILVKERAASALRAALLGPGARGRDLVRRGCVVIGTATDPYQPAERRFRVTRALLEVLAEVPGPSVVIVTKSPLVTRDVDVLARLVGRGGAGAYRVHASSSRITVLVSLITLDRELARRIEPRAPTPESRLRAVARLREAGIDVGINVMPVLPGITDGPAAIESLVRSVAAAGATHINACALRLQATSRERYLPFVEQEFPALAARYRATYSRGHKVGERYRTGLQEFFRAACESAGMAFGGDARGEDDDETSDPAAPKDTQLPLALT